MEKVEVVSHTEKGRKICEKVKITLDTEVINEFRKKGCPPMQEAPHVPYIDWVEDIHYFLKNKSDNINIGLIVETKIPNLDGNKRECLENEEENEFSKMTRENVGKLKLIDRRHFSKVLEEQKLSVSGITDNETVKLGKLLNLDILVLRLIYEKSRVTKVLKVDSGEVLLFKTYETKEKTKEEEWVPLAKTKEGNTYYYDRGSITSLSQNIVKVWVGIEYSKVGIDEVIKWRKEQHLSIDGWEKLYYQYYVNEMDCLNNTSKEIKSVFYDKKYNILGNYNLTTEIQHIIPGTVNAYLLKKVCE